MFTLVPVSNGRVAAHFFKAAEFLFIDDQGKEVKRFDNPGLGIEECKGEAKKNLLEQVVAENPGRIIVRGVGRRMLRTLLSNEFRVFKTCARELDEVMGSHLEELTRPIQGKEPHHRKHHNDCCGHGHNGCGHGHGGRGDGGNGGCVCC